MTSEQLALWVPEPCHDAAPAPQATTAQRRLRQHRIEPEAGRAAGSGRSWTPIGEHVTTIKITGDLL